MPDKRLVALWVTTEQLVALQQLASSRQQTVSALIRDLLATILPEFRLTRPPLTPTE